MHLSIRIKIPYLWGEQEFSKDKWGCTNFLVGPNGTGKTVFGGIRIRFDCNIIGEVKVRIGHISSVETCGQK